MVNSPNILRHENHWALHPLYGEFYSIINNQCESAKLIRRLNELHNQFLKHLRQITRFEEPSKPERR